MKRIIGAVVLAPVLALLPLAASASPLFTTAAAKPAGPVRWNSCKAIHWTFNPHGAPAGALTMTKQAIRTIEAATQADWVFDGVTSTIPSAEYLAGGSTRPVLIGWSDAADSSLLATVSPKVVGETQTVWSGGRYTSAAVALNQATTMPLTGAASWRTTLLHELGHVVGLSHSTSKASLMYPMQSRTLTGLQPVDVARLHALGRAAGC